MQIPEARFIVVGTLLLLAIMVGVYVAFFFRNLALGGNEGESADLLTDFRQMRDEGQLDENEFSRLKEVIPENQMGELGLNGNNGQPVETTKKSEKRFLTLAEAQRQKQEAAESAEPDADHESDESE